MTPLSDFRFWRKRPLYGVLILVCFCMIGHVPVGYGQNDRVSVLITQLKDPNYAVRYKAAYALGETKDPRAVEPLIDALKDSSYSVEE